jgi:hypothetical protein
MKNGLIMLVLAAGSGLAMADTIDAKYVQVAGGTSAAHLRVGGTTYYAGHMMHEFTGGARSGQQFASFCIDLGESAVNSPKGYQIVALKDAPMPGTPYGQVIADRINAVVANAVALGWIDNRLQADSGQANYLAKMGAIQAAIWEAVGGDVRLNASQTSGALRNQHAILMNAQTFDSEARIGGLKAMVAPGAQDMLYVVPLPPAAFAGAGLLAAGLGVRAVRRRG